MNYLECRVGNKDIFIPANDKLEEAIMNTNFKVNYQKCIAKIRNARHSEIYDDYIILNPTFVFALEDTLEQFGYENVFHKTFLEFPNEDQYILFTLLRDAKSFRFLSLNRKIPFEKSLATLQSFFEKISMNLS